jgi:hypothetical protein
MLTPAETNPLFQQAAIAAGRDWVAGILVVGLPSGAIAFTKPEDAPPAN